MIREAHNDATLADLMGPGASPGMASKVARAVGLDPASLSSARLESISAGQLRTLCLILHRSADELLGTGTGCATDGDEREILRLWRGTDERGRSLILNVARGQQGWTEGSALRIVDGGAHGRGGA